jgi:flagellar operon protein
VSSPPHNPAIAPASPADPVRPAAPGPAPAVSPALRPPGVAFEDVLAEKTGELRFSSHALQRVERRGIGLDDQVLARLQSGVARAAAKGSRESVVLVGDAAFVVSIRNRTVITAVDQEHMREHVFTNIDSAVIA